MGKKVEYRKAELVEVEGRGFKPVFGQDSEKNFLGHGINTSASLIDFMVNEGNYSFEEIVYNIKAQNKDVKIELSATKNRVRSHLSWLKNKKGLTLVTDPKNGHISIYKEAKVKTEKTEILVDPITGIEIEAPLQLAE